MIKYVLEKLKTGDKNLPAIFQQLEALWQEEFQNIDQISVDELAKQLSKLQYRVEGICGTRELGKAIMPWSAFAHFYTTQSGYEDDNGDNENGLRALKLSKAFVLSHCSGEVKGEAKAASKTYYVSDYE